MPALSQWCDIPIEIQREVIREGLGQVVNGVAEWIRQGCGANPHIQRGGLWTALRMVEWVVRVSQLPSPIISPHCPWIIVPWLQSSLRVAIWILRTRSGLSEPFKYIFVDNSERTRKLVKQLQKAWLLYSGSAGANGPPLDEGFYHPSWEGVDVLPEFAARNLELFELITRNSNEFQRNVDLGLYAGQEIAGWLNRQFFTFKRRSAAQLACILFIFLAHLSNVRDTDSSEEDWYHRFGEEFGAHIMAAAYVLLHSIQSNIMVTN